MGELIAQAENALDGPIETLRGRVHVRLEEQSQVTSLGELAFFAGHLNTTGVF